MKDASTGGTAGQQPLAEPALVPYEALRSVPATSLLVLAPHPDDEILGCGGLLALAARQGARLRVVIASDGAANGDAAAREAESTAAARACGYLRSPQDLDFWRLPDRGMRCDAALQRRIREAVDETAAQWVLVTSPFEVHPDHRALCAAAIEACRDGAAQLVFYEVGQPLLPNCLVDITSVMPAKLRAMRCFPSQLAGQDYGSQIAALNHYRAYTLGPAVRHAEALYLVPPAVLAQGLDGVLDAMRHALQRRFDGMDSRP